ncbi:SDR family oxidoreductase [Umezawaea beigongshangensis]|uniref:SDR family oxidoreductase n=1 Tax=Umezawaea beigongshangensis TaxID=2780383 RepID=UPI0027DD7F58|nr:NAD(P)H-binding protein [Umezawaea beigongshangensis]
MTILVTGATGLVGRHVVDQLLRARESVRVLTRNPANARFPDGVEVFTGDLLEPGSLVSAFEGVEKLFLFPQPETAVEVVDLAKQAGVRRVVVLSAAAVTLGFDTDYHVRVERAVEESGLEWTHVRPGEFMTNMLPIWGRMIKESRTVRYPFGDDPGNASIHEADIADVAVVALLEDGHVGKAYTLSGPEQLSVRGQVEAIAGALSEEVRYEEVSREEARDILTAMGGFAAESADLLLGFVDYDGGGGGSGDGYSDQDYSELMKPLPGYGEATGKAGRTYAQWARDHVEAFR